MKTSKKILSLVLAVVMVMSVVAVAATAAGAVTYENTKLYFDASSTGWELGSRDKISFYVYDSEGGLIPWGGKKLNGTDEGDGIWSYDPADKGMNIEEGKQYAIIFVGGGNQTYDLLFDTTCYGHVAYCSDVIYENPVDSSQQTRAAFWKDLDASKYGPKLQVSSVGTVVGTCPEQGKTSRTIFEDFLTNNFENAKRYKVDTEVMTEQELIDSVGAGLGLSQKSVALALANTSTESSWSAEASDLPLVSYNPVDSYTVAPDTPYSEEAVIACGGSLEDTQTIYFQAPEDWANEFNTFEGPDDDEPYAHICAYWWSGIGSRWPNGAEVKWVGYQAHLVDKANRIYSIQMPDEGSPMLVWNNGVNAGMDPNEPIFQYGRQTIDVNTEGAYPDEYDTIPEGSPNEDNFDGCILIMNYDVSKLNDVTGFYNYGTFWYIYYGDGCYGSYAQDSDEFVSVEENCLNPEHNHGGSGHKISGKITSYLTAEDEVTVTIEGVGSDFTAEPVVVTSTAAGKAYEAEYAFENVPAGDYIVSVSKKDHVANKAAVTVTDSDVTEDVRICPLGDVNNDGKTTQTDYVTAMSYVRKTKELNDYQIKCGDVFGKGDGKLTAQDANRIVQHTRKVKYLY